MGALCRAIEKVWGKAPLFTRIGGSGPEEALGRVLDAPVLYLGVALPNDRFHAPNERMVMDQFWKGLLAAGELWRELAAGYVPERCSGYGPERNEGRRACASGSGRAAR